MTPTRGTGTPQVPGRWSSLPCPNRRCTPSQTCCRQLSGRRGQPPALLSRGFSSRPLSLPCSAIGSGVTNECNVCNVCVCVCVYACVYIFGCNVHHYSTAVPPSPPSLFPSRPQALLHTVSSLAGPGSGEPSPRRKAESATPTRGTGTPQVPSRWSSLVVLELPMSIVYACMYVYVYVGAMPSLLHNPRPLHTPPPPLHTHLSMAERTDSRSAG